MNSRIIVGIPVCHGAGAEQEVNEVETEMFLDGAKVWFGFQHS